MIIQSSLGTTATAILIGAVLTAGAAVPAQAHTQASTGARVAQELKLGRTQPTWLPQVGNLAGQTFKVLAHRGGASLWPENSLVAFTGAAQAGYDGIETDLQFSADGQPVLSHYDKLPKRCTFAGSRIHKLSAAQLAKVRCADTSGIKNVALPRFDQLAAVLTKYSAVGLTLDIKAFTGQSKASKRLYAKRAVSLVKRYGLLNRTRFLTYNWDAVLPTLRKYAPKSYVLAYDHHGFDYDRVRLAAKLKASGYGTQAKYTSVNLASFIKAKGMEVVPWNISGTQAQAFSIYYGPKTYWFMTDNPAATAAKLTAGAAQLDWLASDQVTTLTKPIAIAKATYPANRYRYPKVLGKAVPTKKLAALKTVQLAITVKNGPAKNSIYLAARSSAKSSAVKITLKKGTTRVLASVPVGDDGKLRIRTTKRSAVTLRVLSYTNVKLSEVPLARTTGR